MIEQKTIGGAGTSIILSDCGQYADIAVETEYDRLAILVDPAEVRKIVNWLKAWEEGRRQLAKGAPR